MADVTFYHQVRRDGGRRSGLHVDGAPVLSGFAAGDDERDPALSWYADVTVVSYAPITAASGFDWLGENGAEIRAALTAAADDLECGIDVDTMPWEFTYDGPTGPVRVTVAAMRRLTARHVGQELRKLAAAEWKLLFPVAVPTL